MKTKMIPLSIFFLLFHLVLFSQNTPICFDYDFAGNRISRTICMTKDAGVNSSTKSTEQIDDDNSLNIGEHEIKIFPNPTTGKFVLSVSNLIENQQVGINLYALNGSLLYEKVTTDAETEIDISQKENGSYILHVIIDGIRTSWKIIKQ